MKIRKIVLLLAVVMLLSAVQLPVFAAEPVWDLLDSDLSNDYTADWKVSGGSYGGAVTQEDGYVNITKGDGKTVTSPTGGAYTWLVPQSLTLPDSGKFTVEVTARAGGAVTADRYGEISVRLGKDSNDTNGKLFRVFIKYGQADGWISTEPDGSNAYTLDTTVWHNYGLVVDRDTLTYSVWVDGACAIEQAAPATYKGGNLLRIGADNESRCNLDIQSARVGTGDLSANLSSATETPALAAPVFPTFAALNYTIEMPDYQYNPTDEFNFPCVVDTKEHPVSNELGDYRYYLFYAPHDAPAGNCVAASNSLDGPWVEYDANPVVGKTWAKEDGSGNYYSVSHVSSPHVMWNDGIEKYVMYFHGENNTTRYATSDDLLHWTYGGVCVVANDFSPSGSGFSEASYARVYEHEVPGLGNKYIMLLMITGSGNSMHRNIYWAYSNDGFDWTPVQTSLLNPDMDSKYKSNFSGPWFMEWEVEGEIRYFVICHATSGEIYAFEVGESLDQCIEWGEIYNSQGVRGTDDANPMCYPDYGRAGAPCFIQDDEGRWHMFYEAGKRLNTNIIHAVEVKEGEESQLARISLEVDDADISMIIGDTAQTEAHLFNMSNQVLANDAQGLTMTYHVSDDTVLSYEAGQITALTEGKAAIWVEATLNGVHSASQKVEITVAAPAKEIILTNADTPNKTALNLELPAPFKAQGVLANPIDNYYLYFSYNDESGGTQSIALATAPAPQGPWTVYQDGTPVITRDSLGLASGGVNSPWPLWVGDKMLMYYSNGSGTIGVAESTDGVHFTNVKTVLSQSDLSFTGNTYQQSVYEYTVKGKGNKYLMLYTGNGYSSGSVTNGKRLFYALSNDGLNWTAVETPLMSPSAPTTGDKGNVASPRLMIRDGEPYVIYHNSNGNIGYAKLSADFAKATPQGIFYDSASGEPDRGRAADGALLEAAGHLYLFYTARSNKASNAADASMLMCRDMGIASDVLFLDDFSVDSGAWSPTTDTWTVEDGVYKQTSTSGGTLTFAGDPEWTDYEIEVKVTPTASTNNIAFMINGRATDANNRYYASYNAGTLTISRRWNSTSAKNLITKPYAMELGKQYTIRLVFSGQKISLYVDEILELEYVDTDNAYSKGMIGLATNKTAAEFDDVVVRSVSAPEATLTATAPVDYQVIQRNVMTENADVAVSGKVSWDVPVTVEVRVMEYAAGETDMPVVDWTPVQNSENVWSGSLTVPQGGWYRLEVRVKDSSENILETLAGENRWGVGINILCIGQSNMVGQGAKPYTIANDLAANCRWGVWKHLEDPYDGAGASIVPAMVNDLIDELGLPVGVIPAAYSGSGLHAPNNNHGQNWYWAYYMENDPFNTSTLYGRAITRVRDAGGAELAVWYQGETDGSLSVSQADYEQDMKLLLQRLRKDLETPNLPIFMCQIGTHEENISNDDAYTGIRSAQQNLDDGENFFLASTGMEFERKDTVHYTTPGLNEIGRRVANSILYYYGKSDYYRGPCITGVDYADTTRQVVNVTIAHRGGSDITPATGITGFSVLDNLTEVAVTEAKRLDATTIQLTLEKPISGSGSLRYLYGLDPDVSNIVKDNTGLQLPLENTTETLMIGDDQPVTLVWDILDHAMDDPWNDEGFRSSTKTGTITQMDGYVNINKGNASSVGSASLYHWVISPAGMALPRSGFTFQTVARAAGSVDGQANEIAVRMGENANDTNGKIASIFLGYGENGYVSASATGTGRYVMELDTTVWHTYTMVVRPEGSGFVYDLYVDSTLAFENVALTTYKGGDLLRFGADNSGRCNLDVQHTRVGSGEILPEGVSPAKLTGITLSDTTQKETESKTVTVTVTGREFQDGDMVELALLDAFYEPIEGVTAQGTFQDNQAVIALELPAGLPVNQCYVRASANGRVIYSEAYTITADRAAPVFPTFTPVSYTIELEDYTYNPTQEFNFPCVVDTKEHPVSNELGDYRYYLFYAPHDAPAGNCVAASNSLDGPWVEYDANPVVGKTWAKEDGSGYYYNVSHVSSPHVMWNDGIGKYVMYFHGENPTTRYATSDDLLHWTYGGVCVNANDFSPSGSGFSEASYARVYEHEVPGLGNKYIMLLMITGSGNSMHRNIYWAYSDDGFDWTPVQTSLLNPDMDPQYMDNFSGPWFMEWEVEGETRYFVICHATSGEIYAFEVGEALDEMIPWGIVYESRGLRYESSTDNEDEWPDYGRAGAPCFIQDDEGVWHMFYEGGKRLHANIVHAVGAFSDDYLAAQVEALIDALPAADQLTLEDEAAVKAAREAYEALTEEQKALVPNLSKLEAAEAWLKELKANEEAAAKVEALIDALPAVDQLTLEDEAAVKAAREAYEALTEEQKALVPNLAKLEAAETQLAELKETPDEPTPVVPSKPGKPVTVQPQAPAAWENPFGDVRTSDWFYDSVAYVCENGLMNGVSATRFAPDSTTTRGMIVTMIYRMEGAPAVYGGCQFADVNAGAYYEKAIVWAAANGIVTGYSETSFGPDDTITREQLAAILYRYADYKGYDTAARASLSTYHDADQISGWALDAMGWALAESLMNGRTATALAPTGTATRAETAAILMRFCEAFEV